MAETNRDRVGKALELIKEGLAPFVQREVHACKKLPMERLRHYADDPRLSNRPIEEWDASSLFKLMNETWREVFHDTLGHPGRSLVSELREWRNKWAHQEHFSSDDADRMLDSAERLLAAISASQAAELNRMKMELRRLVFNEQARRTQRRTPSKQVEAFDAGGIRPWREVVEPHEDVAMGLYQQAEFAADLGQVHRGEGADEYREPSEFFRRTFLTASLKSLLVAAIRRVMGRGGDPVIQLQTNFGGGKTHSMLALYHMFSGTDAQMIPGLDKVLEQAEVSQVDKVRRVVLVGTQISAGDPSKKDDGTEVHTLWGELAYQLGGREAYERVRVDDEQATSPGDKLRELLVDYGPCVILIDEWVAYARQLHDEKGLPGGTFETQFTFAQTLSESVKLTENCLLMVSLPASDQADNEHVGGDDLEVGGRRGKDALERLRNVIARLESPWKPATAEEGFEIVRRRLFKPLASNEAHNQMAATAQAFGDLYQKEKAEFPSECATADYVRRIESAYPIHPEVFDRLYTDWSSLARFQRTRGVLRLMAAVIYRLWASGDRNPLIQPWNFHLDDPSVQNELTRYLSDNWAPVMEKDVDGSNALPQKIDDGAPNLGRRSATRRVARTIYLGSAPIKQAARRGIEDSRIKLGCVMPGERPNLFGDALRRLAGQATYLYQDGSRYWYDTQPTVAKLANDRAEELRRNRDKVTEELEQQVSQSLRQHSEFKRVHLFPRSAADVPDERDARLVVLTSDHAHVQGAESDAREFAQTLIESRGTAPRIYRNSLVFLAADKSRLQDLEIALRSYLAWKSIVADSNALNLDPHQENQAKAQERAAATAVEARIPEAYKWLLVPEQESPESSTYTWKYYSLSASGGLAERAARRLLSEELLITQLGPTVLRMHMDKVPLWGGNHVSVRQLIEYFAQYLYLPRLTSPSVLVNSIREGVSLLTWESESFAFADSYDENEELYRGVRSGRNVDISTESTGLIVKPGEHIETPPSPVPDAVIPTPPPDDRVSPTPPGALPTTPKPEPPQRFYAVATLKSTRIGSDAGRIAEEVVAHLDSLLGADVTVTLEIEARVPEGIPEQIVRIVTENCTSLKLDSHAFEKN